MPDLSLTHLHRPALQGSPSHPGLVLLHGLGSDEHDLFGLAPQLDPRLVVVSARAPFSYQWGGYAWYDLEREGPGLGNPGIEAGLTRLGAFLIEVSAAYSIDPQRLYLGGFSMGAAMTGAFTLLEPERIAGALLISGFLPPDPQLRYRGRAAAGKPVFQAHGTLDQVVDLEYAHLTRDYLLATPVELLYKEYPIGHEVSFDELRDVSAWLRSLLNAAPARAGGDLPARPIDNSEAGS